MEMPTYDRMMVPTLQALANLGGSGRIGEIAEKVIQIMNLPDDITLRMHTLRNQARQKLNIDLHGHAHT